MENTNPLLAILFVFIAGLINGSFALPTKHIKTWKFENIWLQYALWAFVILPWIAMFILVPQVFSIYKAVPANLFLIMLIGGFIFGAGQVCFALALNMIGFGLGFVINLGLGMSLGFFLPLVLQHAQQILTPFGIITLFGTLLALIGLIISNHAGMMRDREKNRNQGKGTSTAFYIGGVILAALAGLSSAGQNFAFSYTAPMQDLAISMGATQLGAANIMWPGFLVCGFLPYAIYMLFLQAKNKTFDLYKAKGTLKYYFFAIFMAACWYGSLLFYSKASQLIGKLGPLVGWPLFMVLIILTSSFWGWRHKEWENASTKAKRTMQIGLGFLILAILFLSYSSHFNA